MIQIRTRCQNPACRAEIRSAADDIQVVCSACGTAVPRRAEGAVWRVDDRLERCPYCDGTEMFVRKDFPQRLGLVIVVGAAILSFILLSRHTLLAMALLAGVVLLDAVIYLFVGKATVCYRCRAEFRGFRYNQRHEAFDLATAEKYPKA